MSPNLSVLLTKNYVGPAYSNLNFLKDAREDFLRTVFKKLHTGEPWILAGNLGYTPMGITKMGKEHRFEVIMCTMPTVV